MQIPIDDAFIAEAVTRAVQELLKREKTQLENLTATFLDDAKLSQRVVLADVDRSVQDFRGRAKDTITEADAAIRTFTAEAKDKITEADATIKGLKADVETKKAELKEALNAKVLVVFTSVVIILSLAALAYLGDRLRTVSDESTKVLAAAQKLSQDSSTLQGSIDAANKAYTLAFAANKDASLAIQLTTLSGLTNKMNGTLETVKSDTEALKTKTAPIIADWVSSTRRRGELINHMLRMAKNVPMPQKPCLLPSQLFC